MFICLLLSGILFLGLNSYHDYYVYSSGLRDSNFYYDYDENIEYGSDSIETYAPDLNDYSKEKFKYSSGISAYENYKYITGLCTGLISNPVEPSEEDLPWEGSYVVFGTYNERFVIYRVLDADSDKYGGNTLFLDCDNVLFNGMFRENINMKNSDDYQNLWSGSDLINRLNGEEFLLYNDYFTDVERNSIFESIVDSYELNGPESDDQIDPLTAFQFENYTPLNGEKIFCLDIEDVYNRKYGYSDSRDINLNHHKESIIYNGRGWWLRSTYKSDRLSAARINPNGNLYIAPVNDDLWPGISPALNIDRKKIVFSSYLPGYSNVFKLTLIDENINLCTAGKISRYGSKIFVPYETNGTDCNLINRFSVILLNKPYVPGNENEAELICYLDAFRDKDSRYLTFELPDEYYNEECYIYALAEYTSKVNSADYASKPYLLNLPEEDVYYVMRGDTLGKIAKKLDMDVNTLTEKNNIEDPDLIFAGQEIIFK